MVDMDGPDVRSVRHRPVPPKPSKMIRTPHEIKQHHVIHNA